MNTQIAAGIFLSGALAGFLAGITVASELDVADAIALVVTLLWTLSMVAETMLPHHQTGIGLHSVMVAAASYLFGTEVVPIARGGGAK